MRLHDLDKTVTKKYHFPGWVKIISDSSSNITKCFPHMDSMTLKNARNMLEFPYRHGWCMVCPEGNTHDCKPSPDHNWGWCNPSCEEDQYTRWNNTVAHEAAVDAFIYPNCSKSINTWTEFCTGTPIISGFGQVWRHESSTGSFSKVKNELQTYVEEPGWNGNNTILRPGSRYQAIQHSNSLGDACYGDAGGSVWKYWMFQDQSEKRNNRVHQLAVLTGVLSRFEEYCGVFRPDTTMHYSKPVQHTIHTRITSILDWVNYWIGTGRCVENEEPQAIMQATNTMTEETTTEDYN